MAVGRVNVGGRRKLISNTLSKLFLIREENSNTSGESNSIIADDTFIYLNRTAVIHKLDKETFISKGSHYVGATVNALNQDTEHLYVGTTSGITKVLKSTLETVGSGHSTSILSIAIEDDFVYCTDGNKNLIKLDRYTLELVDSIKIGSVVVYDLAIDGDNVYCTRSTGGGTNRTGIVRVDKNTFDITGESPAITTYIDGVDVIDDRIFYIGSDGVIVLDKATMESIGRISIGQTTFGIKQIIINKKAKALFVVPVYSAGVGVASTDTLNSFSTLTSNQTMTSIGMFNDRLYAVSDDYSIREYLINI